MAAGVGSTCPAAAVDTPAEQADRNRLAGRGIEAEGVAGCD